MEGKGREGGGGRIERRTCLVQGQVGADEQHPKVRHVWLRESLWDPMHGFMLWQRYCCERDSTEGRETGGVRLVIYLPLSSSLALRLSRRPQARTRQRPSTECHRPVSTIYTPTHLIRKQQQAQYRRGSPTAASYCILGQGIAEILGVVHPVLWLGWRAADQFSAPDAGAGRRAG